MRVLAQAHQRAHAGRIHELDAIEIEHDLVRVGRQARRHARADDARGEDVEHPRHGRGSDSERVDDDDLSRGVCHAPVLPRFRGDGNPHVRHAAWSGERIEAAATGAARRRSVYGRIPPARNTSRSNGVSIRAIVSNSMPSAATRTSRGSGPSSARAPIPEIAEHLVAGEPERRHGFAGARTRAAARPSRRGSTGGCARTSRRCTARTPSSCEPFAAQSRELPEPYSLPASTTSGTPSAVVLHRRVVDRRRLAVGKMDGEAALGAGRELVAQPHVGERAAHHHFVVPAPRAVGVEVARLVRRARAATRPAGPSRPDDAGRRDVVGRDAVAEQREHTRAVDVGRRHGVRADALEERRPADVRRRVDPTCSARRSARGAPASARRRRAPPSSAACTSRSRAPTPTTSAISSDGRPDVAQVHRACRRSPSPSGSSRRSMSIVPASAYATTSGGDAR